VAAELRRPHSTWCDGSPRRARGSLRSPLTLEARSASQLAVVARDIRALRTARLRLHRKTRLRSTFEPWLTPFARTPCAFEARSASHRADRARAATTAFGPRARLTGRSSPFGQWRVAPRTPRPSSPPGACLLYRLPNVHRRDSLCDTYRPWWTERARAGRVHFSRLSDPYSTERSEGEYVAQRPRAARGLSTLTDECGCGRVSSHGKRPARGLPSHDHEYSTVSRSCFRHSRRTRRQSCYRRSRNSSRRSLRSMSFIASKTSR